MRRRTGFTLIELLLAVCVVAISVLAFVVYNMNKHMARIDASGRRLTEWAVVASRYMKHDNDQHAADYHGTTIPPSHIPPPPPPDPW